MHIGSVLGPYRILRLLGSGGMGAVWLAEDTRLHRQVALKTLRPADSQDEQSRARLMREARAAAALNHSHIATVYDVLENDGQVVIVFEYVEGETLSARLARDPLPAPEAVDLGCQIARALVAAHAQGIVHRDLKPANVIVGAGGQVKVLDFGIARLLSIGTTQTSGDGQTASGPGFIGTPGYAAPEQMVSSAVDERADLYALGVMLFEMISGRRPFPGNDVVALASAKLSQDAPPLVSTGRLVPPDLAGIIDALLARDRERRPSSAADVLAQLRAVYSPASTKALPRGSRRRGMTSVLIGAAVLVAAVAGLGLLAWQRRAVPPASASAPPVVAVMPLENMSGDPSRDFVAAGIADSLITSLAALPTVTVLSRASVAEARGRSSQPSILAKELGANYLVEGSVQESGGQMRVSLTLVRPDRSVAWGDNVEGTFATIFDLQRRLAASLTSALSVRVSASERNQMNAQPTSSPEALAAYWRGRALMERGDIKGNVEAAINAFGEALALDGRFALAHAALGRAYWSKYTETKDPAWAQKAIEEGTTALRIDPDRSEVRFTLAITLAGSGRLDEAVEELHRALALQPNYDEARRQLGQVLAQQGRIDESVAEFRKAIALRPTVAGTYSALGVSLVSAARYREAAQAFEQMIALAPDNFAGYQQLGAAYQYLGDNDAALLNYDTAIKIRPSATAYSNIGGLYHQRGEFNKAVDSYRQAIALRPNSAATHRNLGDALNRLGRSGEARKAYGEAVRLAEADLAVNPRDARIMASLAVFLQKAGEPGRAEARVQEAIEKAPADVEVLFRSAVVHALASRPMKALEALQQAVAGGYSPASIAGTEEFVSIRNHPQFVRLLKETK